MSAADEEQAPGWASIDGAFAGVYPGARSEHWSTAKPPEEGGVLAGISAFEGHDWWHFVTYGLTDLFAKRGEDPELSGWGYELTLLAPKAPEPPPWAFRLLYGLATTTQQQDRWFDLRHRIDTGAPIDGADSALTGIVFCADRVVAPTTFPLGKYDLLQVVGVTPGELAEMRESSTEAVLERLAAADPYLRTDPART